MKKTIILRHRRENLKKCSLHGLENRADLVFYTYPTSVLPDLTGYIILKVDAPILTLDDQDKGIFLIDATWALAEKIGKQLPGHFEVRSLPEYKTAYPRTPNPDRGLASIEALYLAHKILNRNVEGLLDNYYWKDSFLSVNNL